MQKNRTYRGSHLLRHHCLRRHVGRVEAQDWRGTRALDTTC